MRNKSGMEVAITNFGATIVRIKVPDREGRFEDVVPGFDTVHEYEKDRCFFGSTIGRFSNRIAHGKFQLGGELFSLPKNDGDHTLHGGHRGFSHRLWAAKEVARPEGAAVEFSYLSRDGEEGFPGNLRVKVVFTLPNDRNEIQIRYSATTDKLTVVNFTNHSYFNLCGQGNGDILSHSLQLNAVKFVAVDGQLIPTGEILDVQGTPFDFTRPTPIGERINGNHEQLKVGRGYDHCWILTKEAELLRQGMAAMAYEPESGRVLEILTDEIAVQFYCGNFLDGTVRGKEGKAYGFRSAFCLETQRLPDSPNHRNFPSTNLAPGELLDSTTIFRFSVR